MNEYTSAITSPLIFFLLCDLSHFWKLDFLCMVLGITWPTVGCLIAPIAVHRLAGERMVPTVADT